MGRSVAYATDAEHVFYTTFECDGVWDQYDQWDDFVEEIRYALHARFSSLRPADDWLEQEVRAIAENELAHVTVSEYCGLVAVCLVPKTTGYTPNTDELAKSWCRRCSFMECLTEHFGGRLQSLGRASNGEQFFRRVEA